MPARSAITGPHPAASILDGIPDAYVGLDSEFRYTFINREAGRLIGIDRETLLGKCIWLEFPYLLGTDDEREYRRVATEKVTSSFETFSVAYGKWYRVTAYPAVSGGITVHFRDITESKKIKEELHRSNAELERTARLMELAHKAANAGAWDWDLETGKASWTEEYFRLLGVETNVTPTQELFLSIVHPDDLEMVKRSIEDETNGRVSEFRQEYRAILPDGVRWIERRGHVIADANGKAIRLIGISTDITARKRIEEALQTSQEAIRTSNEELQSVLNSIREGLVRIDEQYRFTYVNASAERILGRSGESLSGKTIWDEYPGLVGTVFETNYRRVMKERTPLSFEYYYQEWNRWFEIHVYPAGRGGIAAVFRDITQQRRLQQDLRESEERLRVAQRAARSGVWSWRINTTELYWSEEIYDLFGLDRETVPSMEAWLSTIEPDHRAGVEESVHQAIRGRHQHQIEFPISRHGERRWIASIGDILYDSEGNPARMTGIGVDITERRRAEEETGKLEDQLRQAQKLESVGRLAAGVAHDFNNLLTVISGHSEFLLRGLSSSDTLLTHAVQISKAGERAASLTKQLLAFSRNQMIDPHPMDLNTLMRDTGDMFHRLLGEDIEVLTILDPGLGHVMADPGQIHQVLLNLVMNARDAMPKGGKIVLETMNADVDESYAALHPESTPGRYVAMIVTDTGIGMDEKTRKSIFEPFFTTKELGNGAGLGLSTVYGIVRQSGGWIDVWSEEGEGTLFKIYLPRTDASPAPAVPVKATPEKCLNGGETVLLVEDQPAVRMLTATILTMYGYNVLEASNGTEALVVANEHLGDIHLLLTDVVMPGMNGKELSERLTVSRPTLQVLYTSGYTTDLIAHRGVLDNGVAFISKPFSPDGLADKIRDVLTHRPG